MSKGLDYFDNTRGMRVVLHIEVFPPLDSIGLVPFFNAAVAVSILPKAIQFISDSL
jgi:hypothetical protein